VNFEWRLDTYHGADYFRRWHRRKANSGGLFVHKATHHFDLLNWWLGSVPRRVAARGRRVFYRPETAEAFELAGRGERCSACAALERCRVKLNVAASAHLSALYADNEGHDGYFRDRCVFSSKIDIEDTMHATIEYENGTIANYLLTAYNPGEGYRAMFHGIRGSVVLDRVERPFLRRRQSYRSTVTRKLSPRRPAAVQSTLRARLVRRRGTPQRRRQGDAGAPAPRRLG
jgi:predicted dehydrogenase